MHGYCGGGQYLGGILGTLDMSCHHKLKGVRVENGKRQWGKWCRVFKEVKESWGDGRERERQVRGELSSQSSWEGAKKSEWETGNGASIRGSWSKHGRMDTDKSRECWKWRTNATSCSKHIYAGGPVERARWRGQILLYAFLLSVLMLSHFCLDC